ncbi:MAG: phosphate acyltransferase PlsX [Gammaproteobacteria bacterium]|nr:MAG: phosphate acyltransferase PlsX [Gammaproteobacteria bacterium]
MGGDHGVTVVVPAALNALKKHLDISLILVGDHDAVSHELMVNNAGISNRLSIHHASQQVEMTDTASTALRGKKDSSMRVGINLVKEGLADACVSSGNTGALMATARFVLKTLPGIDRPAICSALPTTQGHTHMLDLGANVDSSANSIFEFALMGSELARAVDNIPNPTVGLLNIGEEEIKGNERVKEAGRLLADSDLNYTGFIEGDDIYKGKVDVVVCDGFVGNVALKSSEGVAYMFGYYIRQEFKRNLLTKLIGLISRPVIHRFRKRMDPREYNGASLLGLQGIIIKSHGSADTFSFTNAINVAVAEVEKNVPGQISAHLENLLAGEESA